MKIVHVRALRGPNYWSVSRHQLIVAELNVEESENLPTNKIPGFYERLKSALPAMYSHCCTDESPGAFFEQVQKGIWIGHVIERIAHHIQSLPAVDCSFSPQRENGTEGCYQVVFPYEIEAAGIWAAKAAVCLTEALINGEMYNIGHDIERIQDIVYDTKLGPSTNSIVAEATRRGIPAIRLDNDAYVQLGYGAKHKKIEASIAGTTGAIGVELAGDKHRTKQMLKDNFVPVPYGVIIRQADELQKAIDAVEYPLVIKPLDGNQGKGATTNIQSMACAADAFHRAKAYSKKVIVEKFITGYDFRALVINHQFVAAAKRIPAAVTGDGIHTIQALIDQVNNEPERGCGHGNMLTKIKVDEDTKNLLKKHHLTLKSVLPLGQVLCLKTTANLSTGGTAEDVTDGVHPANVALFERIARIIGLDICGIDVMAPGLSQPITETGGAVIEVNAAPGLRMHLQPTIGVPRNVAAPIVDMLFPEKGNGRIPIIAVTGTNGKTTTTRLIARMSQLGGFTTGFTTTDGIYLNKELIYKGDCSGPGSARVVLGDPAVEFAVLECARGGILRSGLGFDVCDCAVVTNVAEDHLGLGGIDTVEKLARVKMVVPQTVKKDGYAVLNADDDLVYHMKENLSCKVALFSLNGDSERIQQHCSAGGIAAVCEEGYIILRRGNNIIVIDEVENIAVTYGGKAKFNVANALSATLAAYVTGIPLPAIRCTLRNFTHSAETTPGRMNSFYFRDFTVMVDYAHNPHGLRAFGEYVQMVTASKKTGIIAGTGDRRAEDLIALGEEAGKIFDEIIIRMDNDLRGRTELEISSLLRRGIQNTAGNKKISYIPGEINALEQAIQTAEPNSFIVLFADDIPAVCHYLKQQTEQWDKLYQHPVKEAV